MKSLQKTGNTLIIGIGNSGRADDALGWRFLNEITECQFGCDCEYRYQLQIEDAELMRHYTHVIFVDASHNLYKNGFSFYPCSPDRSSSFTTHRLSPGQTLALAQDLYNADTDAWVFAISGEQWNLHNGLSEYAQNNLRQAQRFFQRVIPCIINEGPRKPDLSQFQVDLDKAS